MSEESIHHSFLRSTQNITEAYAPTVKLLYRQMRMQRLLPAICVILSTHSLQNTFAQLGMTFGTCHIRMAPNVKNIHPVVIGVHQPIGSNDRCLISSTVGDALRASFFRASPPRHCISQIPATWGISSGQIDVCKICEGTANHPSNCRA
jgi:hypothetical protein